METINISEIAKEVVSQLKIAAKNKGVSLNLNVKI